MDLSEDMETYMESLLYKKNIPLNMTSGDQDKNVSNYTDSNTSSNDGSSKPEGDTNISTSSERPGTMIDLRSIAKEDGKNTPSETAKLSKDDLIAMNDSFGKKINQV